MQVSMSLLRRKLEEAMATEVPTTAEQIRARHILVEEEDAARAALERIRNGEDFARVAMEVSIDPGSQEAGGDLGWFPRGQMLSEFDEVAFALQPGEVSDLVETYHGYHVIKVEERDAHRPLDEALLAERRGRVLADWLAEQRASEGVQRRLSSDRVPQDPAPAGW
jgi:parvulin-like peptidyl-prolyl isomerase